MKNIILTLKNTTALRIMTILLISLTVLAGCDKTVDDVIGAFGGNDSESSGDEKNAVKLTREVSCYNDYLGVSYTIPKGWWLYYLNEDNFGESKGTITDDITMDIGYGDHNDYSFSNIWLVDFGNLEKAEKDNHLGFSLDARSLKDINDMPGYMKYFEMFMLEPAEGREYQLTSSEQISIKGKPFELRNYLVTQGDESEDFCVLTFSCQIKQGYFFNISVDYWAENTKAKQAIIDSVGKAIEFY